MEGREPVGSGKQGMHLWLCRRSKPKKLAGRTAVRGGHGLAVPVGWEKLGMNVLAWEGILEEPKICLPPWSLLISQLS